MYKKYIFKKIKHSLLNMRKLCKKRMQQALFEHTNTDSCSLVTVQAQDNC